MNGVVMQRTIGVVAAAVLASLAGGGRISVDLNAAVARAAPLDVAALLSAAQGAPRLICSLAAQSVGNGWGSWTDAPATPLGRLTPLGERDRRNTPLAPA